jgi:hypothetical protein
MTYFQLNNEHQSKLFDFISKRRDDTELEIRFGKFAFNQNTGKKEFQSNSTPQFFFHLQRTLQKHYQTKITKTKELIYPDENGGGNVKQIIHEDGSQTYMCKRTVRKYDVYDYDFRISAATEETLQSSSISHPKEPSCVREKQRTTYFIEGVGQIDLTLVHENNSSIPKFEVEFEITTRDANVVFNILTVILQVRCDNVFITNNAEKRAVLNDYKMLTGGYFFIGAQPETLQKQQLSNLYKETYSVTDKADGERAFVIISGEGKVYLADANLLNVCRTEIVCSGHHNCILDAELVVVDGKKTILVFDILIADKNDLRGKQEFNLVKRLKLATDIVNAIPQSPYYAFGMKTYYMRNVFLGSEVLLKEASKNKYGNDGLIFTPVNDPYPTVKKWNKLYKWKPSHLNSIDFYSVKRDDGVWELYVQHVETNNGNRQTKQSATKVLFDINKLCPSSTPVQDITSFTQIDDAMLDPITNQPYMSHTVIEYNWDSQMNKFVPLRTRWDKTCNPNKHGNFSTIACDIWNNIHSPVDEELLYKFSSPKSEMFFDAMRKFHNKVKEQLYNQHVKGCKNLLELCSGKGGDLHKWIYNKVQNVTGYDICEKSILECERRVAQMNPQMSTRFHKLDLCGEQAPAVVSQHRGNTLYNTICCHFAVHYFFQSESTYRRLQQILRESLSNGGRFIVTFMDNQQLGHLFGDNDNTTYKVVDNEVAYILNKGPQSDTPFGNKLKIVLNGNNYLGEGSSEFVVDTKWFIADMQKAGFEVVTSNLFSDMTHLANDLSEIERDISYLNRFVVFQKSSSQQTDMPTNEVCEPSPPKKTTFPTTNLSDFHTIDIQRHNLSLAKVNTTHDIIDTINCIDFCIYKLKYPNNPITSFDDVEHLFSQIMVPYKPIFTTSLETFQHRNAIYFTFNKHVVEKVGSENEKVEYDNWYIIMHKGQLIFDGSNIAVANVDEPKMTREQNEHEVLLNKLNSTNMSVKELKQHLNNNGLKQTGKKDELHQRLMEHLTSKLSETKLD